jgi:hypothetical protein
MDNLLYLVLGAIVILVLLCLYRSGMFQSAKTRAEGVEEKMIDSVMGFFGQDEKKPLVTGPVVDITVDDGLSVPDLGQDAPSQPAGSVAYPMGGLGYPSGILPGQVGTFHPTKTCDRFVCDGCTTCMEGDCGSKTDDSGRNYPELIDKIRVSRTDEYPFYRMS